jgi:hypothetical protein
VPAQHGPQRAIDLPRVLAHPHLLALGALHAAARRPVRDRRLADGARDGARDVVDRDLEWRLVRRDLEKMRRALGERQHEGGLRERHGAQERLHVEAVRDLDGRAEAVRESERLHVLWRREDGEAVRLQPPERRIVYEVVERLLDARNVGLVGVRLAQLAHRLTRSVLELDPARLDLV